MWITVTKKEHNMTYDLRILREVAVPLLGHQLSFLLLISQASSDTLFLLNLNQINVKLFKQPVAEKYFLVSLSHISLTKIHVASKYLF